MTSCSNAALIEPGVEMQPREDFRDGYGMRDVGIAVAALLALVGLGRELVRLRDARDIGARQVRLELRDEATKVIGPPYRRQSAFADGGTIVHGV